MKPPASTGSPPRPARTASFGEVLDHLRAVQKPSLGAPLYSQLVNRRLGRVFAALAFRLGISPNAVTGISGALSAAAIAVLVLVAPSWPTGVAVALLLSLAYAVDSADGQVARLTGRAGPAGEWLDHMVDCVKISALHLGVLVACYRFGWSWGAGADGWLLVPIGFAVVGASTFFGMTLLEQLRRARGRGGPAGRASLARTLFVLPMDYGLLCIVFLVWGSGTAFAVGYGALFLGTTAFWLVALRKWFRDLVALADVPPVGR